MACAKSNHPIEHNHQKDQSEHEVESPTNSKEGQSPAAHMQPSTEISSPQANVEKAQTGALTQVAPTKGSPPPLEQPGAKGWRFWMIFPPLCIATLLVALESTVTSTALPRISAVLHAGDEYPWYLNAYLLTNAATLPIWGQFAFVFGRRYPIIIAVAVFMIGSGISGGATSSAMMIAGRTTQGCGGGGVSGLTQLIISDLVSVRERGKYMGIIFAVFGVGTSIGPVIGGVIVQSRSSDAWRWVFWLNLPVCAITLVLQVLFLQVTYRKIFTLKQKIKQIDWVGSFVLIGSVLAVLIALSWADTRYRWSNWRIIFSLLIGFVGWGIFHVWEASSWCGRPTVSPKVFSIRTSSISLGLTFCQSMLTYWRIYFLPAYFQSVLLVSPGRSGVLLLPSVLTGIPTAIIAGRLLTRFGRYKPIHLWGFAITTLGVGLYIDLDDRSSLAKIVLYQIVTGLGNGALLTTLLPAVQAPLPPSETTAATSTWGFVRAYGSIWGVALPIVIFNSHMATRLPTIPDERVQQTLGSGAAYSYVSGGYIRALPTPIRHDVIQAYKDSLKQVWEVCAAICGACLVFCLLEKEVPMRTTIDGDFGIKRKAKLPDAEKARRTQRNNG